jgi:hypothetical protein
VGRVAHGVRLHRADGAGHGRQQRRRIEPAAEEQPERHVTAELQADRVVEAIAHDPGNRLPVRQALGGGRVPELPVPHPSSGAALQDQGVAGGNPLHALEERRRADRVPEGQEGVELVKGEPPRHVGVDKQRLRLGRELHAAAAIDEVERLDAHVIDGQDEPLEPAVPERQRVHAAQRREQLQAALLVEVRDRLAVAPGSERVPARGELRPQLDVVEDLAVEDQGDGAVLVEERLIAVLEVDDAEPADAQRHARGLCGKLILPGAVRPPVGEDGAHGAHHGRPGARRAGPVVLACDSTHLVDPPARPPSDARPSAAEGL